MTDISIIMPVYNPGQYLTKALDSIVAQTYDHTKMELIAVDNGSTDGSGEELDRYAERYPFIEVIHQENSGTPSAPRNRGLEAARGEYVFFCDSDDCMGEEAVERMLAHAREWNSDVLLAKLVGVGGRKAPASMFTENQPSADLYTSRVTWTLGPWKLFRLSMLEEFNIRFPEDSLCEDINFVLNAYFHANVISVAADYDYYFYVHRDDGQNITLTSVWKKIDLRVRGVEHVFELIEHYSDAEQRDPILMLRLFRGEVAEALELVPSCPPDDQERWFRRIRECALPYYGLGNSRQLSVETHLLLNAMAENSLQLVSEIVTSGSEVLSTVELSREEGRTYCTYRSPADQVLSVTADVTDVLPAVDYVLQDLEWGVQHLTLRGMLTASGLMNGAPSVTLVLRSYPEDGAPIRFPARLMMRPTSVASDEGVSTNEFEWVSAVDLTTLRGGSLAAGEAVTPSAPDAPSSAFSAPGREHIERWDFYLEVMDEAVARVVRIGANRDEGVSESFLGGCACIGSRVFSPYQTGFRNFSLQETDAPTALSQLGSEPFVLSWSDTSRGRLRLKGGLGDKKCPAALKVSVILHRTDRGADEDGAVLLSGHGEGSSTHLVPAKVKGKGFEVILAAGMVNGEGPLAPGDWEILVMAELCDRQVRLLNEIILPKLRRTRYRRRFGFYGLTIDGPPAALRVRRIL